MSENVRNKVKELLGSGKISGFLGLSNKYGHMGPHLFTDENDLDHLVVGDWEAAGGYAVFHQ
jgi:formate dehydrogenase subunit beta